VFGETQSALRAAPPVITIKFQGGCLMNATNRRFYWVGILIALSATGCHLTETRPAAAEVSSTGNLTAKTYDSGFADSHDTYNGISVASNGKVYYVLCSEKVEVGGQMYSFDPAMEKIEHLGDLTEACGEKNLKRVPQGKSHVSFVESNGKLYFATHIGYYSIKDGMETIGDPPVGYKPYPGGHFLAYDLAAKKYEDLATAPHGEGILAMTMDVKRGQLFGLSWPTGYLLHYDLSNRQLKNLGKVSGEGEKGKGAAFRTLCRSLIVDPADGAVYLTNSEGSILRYLPSRGFVETVPNADMRKDYFGVYDPSSPGHMGYNWRQTFWYPPEQSIYGVHGNSGYLFRFDPHAVKLEVLERITSRPSKRSGMYDQFSYGYLGFALGPDSRTIYYLTGGPVYIEGKRVEGKKNTAKGEAKGQENLHLITYDIPDGKYEDQGPITLDTGQRPAYVNSIAVGKDGTVYSMSRIMNAKGKFRTDLFAVRSPFQSR
jgi:hypothetical protein